MLKKILGLMIAAVIMLGVFGLTGCESINRVTVNHENLVELQTTLPELYYFNFEAVLETNDLEINLVYEPLLQPVEFTSKAIVTQNASGKNYEHFGYKIIYNLKINSETVVLLITAFKHNSRDFIVTDTRINSEYQNAVQKESFIEERIIDDIQCVAYGDTTAFFWTNEQQYTITIHQSIKQDIFTINNFFTLIEPVIINRYKI